MNANTTRTGPTRPTAARRIGTIVVVAAAVGLLPACGGVSEDVACPLSESEMSAITGRVVRDTYVGDMKDVGIEVGMPFPVCTYSLVHEYDEVAMSEVTFSSLPSDVEPELRDEFFNPGEFIGGEPPTADQLRPEWGELAAIFPQGARFEGASRLWSVGIVMSNASSSGSAADLTATITALVESVRKP